MEEKRRECLSCPLRETKMDKTFDSENERECFSCSYDLHLAAAGCECSPNRFSCLIHAKELCACEPTRKFFLSRYSIDELNTLLKALEGDVDAVLHWGSDALGLIPPSDTILNNAKDLKKTCLSNSDDLLEEQQIDVNITDALLNCLNYGSQVLENIAQEDNKSNIMDLDPVGVTNRTISLVTDDKLFPDLKNMEKCKSATVNSRDNCKAEESAARQEQCCSSNLAKQSTSLVVGGSECAIQRTREHDWTSMADASLRSGLECGSSVSHNPSSDAATSSSLPASCSRGTQHIRKSCAKLFGIELHQLQPSISATSEVQSHFKLASSKPVTPNKGTFQKKLPYSVEPLCFGTMMYSKQWCSREAIFPKGSSQMTFMLSSLW